jgi:hypothetical protein
MEEFILPQALPCSTNSPLCIALMAGSFGELSIKFEF